MGSLRAEKMEYDVKRAALEDARMRGLKRQLLSVQHLKRKLFKRERFSLVTCPRADTSIEKKDTTYRWARSAISGEYFSVLKVWLRAMFDSQGHVSSKTITC